MGNVWGGESDNNSLVSANFKVNREDPAKARKNKKSGRGVGASYEDNGRGGASTDFNPDPELEQPFPERQVEYETKPCLGDMRDQYTEDEKARSLRRKDRSGAQGAYSGDRDFAL